MTRENLATMIRESAERFGDGVAMRFKGEGTWHDISYRQLLQRIEETAGGLIELGVSGGDRVAIMSHNGPEWAIADFAIQSVGAISVPIYPTSTGEQARYILLDAGIDVAFAGDQEEYDLIAALTGDGAPRRIIAMNEGVAIEGENSLSMEAVRESGQASGTARELRSRIDERLAAVGPDDLASLVYTSGTTGEPKGVMLSHGNFFHQFRAVGAWFEVKPSDRSLCFLPLSHVYERSWSYFIFHSGAQNNYLRDPKQIVRYLAEVRPSVMVSAPRLYEKIYQTIHGRLENAPALRRKLFHWAIDTGLAFNEALHGDRPIGAFLKLKHKLADKLVLHKIRDIVGGPKNFFSAGGAPMAAEIEALFFAAGILVCRGYGLTETAPMLTANCPGAFRFGSVGRPVVECTIRIADDGEILARGPNVMKGYWNKPEATEGIFADGWLRTGDIGEIDEDGFLTITDRKKDLIITSGGKNVAPQHVETTIGKDHFIEQITVLGDGRKYVAALIVPVYEALEELARKRGWNFRNRRDLIRLPEVAAFFRDRIEKQSACLARFEKIRKFRLLPEDFTLACGEITPTLKIRRAIIAARYNDLIEEMYA